MHDVTLRGLAGAGQACLGATGSRRTSLNALTYSARARRRAFDREADALRARLEAKVGPVTGWPETDEDAEEVAAFDPDFAVFWSDLKAAKSRWLG